MPKISLPPSDAIPLFELLVARLRSGSVVATRPETFPGYKEVHNALGLSLKAGTYGDSLSHQGLASLTE